MNPDFWSGKRIVVTGGAGFIGSHVVERLLETRGVPRDRVVVPRSRDCDLRRPEQAERLLEGSHVVIHLAAVTGGIQFSRAHPADQYRDSTLIDLNVFAAAARLRVQKLVAIGNLFAYAGDAPVPLREETLFDGLPSESHRGVGWMKRNLALLADLYHREHGLAATVVYSANAYGPRDSIDLAHAHVIPSTIMKCMREQKLLVWGDGSPTRDFLFASDVAEGLLLAAERLDPPGYVNIGSGAEVSIRTLVETVVQATDFKGEVVFDSQKPGGDARRCTSVDKAQRLLDFKPTCSLQEGLSKTVTWYRDHVRS
jgi:GDP-L-fucose synthase